MAFDPSSLEENVLTIDMRNLGTTGLRRLGGLIFEEPLPQLEGLKGMAVYKEMALNDSMCGAILNAIDKTIRRVTWRTVPASTRWYDKEAEQFLQQCMHDMQNTWTETVSEILSMLTYGFSTHELVYKRRCGRNIDPSMNSRFKDGRIGWRYMPIRSQDTIFRWHFDAAGDVVAIEQQAPPNYNYVLIPMEKILLFRTSVFKNNPMGLSIFRNAYRPWYLKRGMENIEGIGAERDLAGIPKAFVPPELLAKQASAKDKALLGNVKKMVTNLRNDEQAGLVLPAVFDDKGNRLFDITLMTSGGTRQFDTDKIITRYERQIASVALADFLVTGNSASGGSKAMHTDKSDMFEQSLAAYMDIIAEVINRVAIPRLFALNSFVVSDYPQIEHGSVSRQDIKDLADYVFKLTQAGMPMFPDVKLEEHLRKAASLPPPPKDDSEDTDTDVNEEMSSPGHEQVQELPDAGPSGVPQPGAQNAQDQEHPENTSSVLPDHMALVGGRARAPG